MSRFACWVCGEVLDTERDHAVTLANNVQRRLRPTYRGKVTSRVHVRCLDRVGAFGNGVTEGGVSGQHSPPSDPPLPGRLAPGGAAGGRADDLSRP